MSTQDAIVIDNVFKSFKKTSRKNDHTTLKSELVRLLKRQRKLIEPATHIEALRGVNLRVAKGTTVGIIGRNGSGKSTLLKLMTGIYAPTTGTIDVRGRISALLELGAGFHPDFTGRENILINGIILGMSRAELKDRMPAIIEFAELGDFIDEPVRTYSSGMFVRLAFATMIHVDANILVIDEAIAVGDAGFRARCFRRLGELGATGCTILFVTHAMEQVTRFCGRALLLDHGRVAMQGTPAPVVAECLRLQAVLPENDAGTEATAGAYAPNGAQIEAVQLTDAGGQEAFPLCSGLDYRCRFRARLDRPAVDVRGAFLIRTETGAELGGGMTPRIESLLGGATVEVELSFVCRLNPGTYRLDIALFAREGGIEFALHGIRNALPFKVVRRDDQASLGAVDFECRATINRMTTELA